MKSLSLRGRIAALLVAILCLAHPLAGLADEGFWPFNLYQYKKFTDVRVVFAPEFDIAFFGGDPDNFTFPCYALDMTLFRVYENGKPLAVTNFLPWSTTGTKEGEAVFATQGEAAYPDGTFTLRLSYGAVKGYQENGKTIAPYTDFRGLYVRADQHGLKPPYKYPETWTKARGPLALNTPFDFVTTNDIVGGNSGSPVINARGELVGLIFDGNIQSLPGYFVYEGAINRAIAVDVRGMIEALRKVYGAEALVSELLAVVATPVAKR